MSDMTFVQRTKKDVWMTPDWLWESIDERDGIDLDPCAGANTSIGDTNWTVEDDGLTKTWFGVVWVNPPFSQKERWLQKIREEKAHCERIYIVTPDSTDVRSWWHDDITDMCDWTWFSDGRVRYLDPETGEQTGSPPFGTAVSVVGNVPDTVAQWFCDNGDLVRRVRDTEVGTHE